MAKLNLEFTEVRASVMVMTGDGDPVQTPPVPAALQ